MCGIAAAIGVVDRVPGLVRALAHRGPDQRGTVGWEGFALGAARLRINGDARADQPIEAGGAVVLAANAEVFNHAELRGGAGEAAEGDLLPLVRLLESGFPGAVERIRGPFAVAALDRRTRRLMLARDENGVRPLHVASAGAGLLAASEIWPMLEAPEIDASLDEGAIAHLLAFQFLPPGRTAFRSIASVRPGEILVFDRDARLTGRQPFRYAASDGAGGLCSALREAAALQGARVQRAAIFLSGGIDSSAVAALLSDGGQPPDVAFAGYFPEGDPALDERGHARGVAGELGIPLVDVPIRSADALEALPALVRALGGPVAGPGGLAQFVLARAAARDGVRIVYSGDGGDELFGGYERHRLLQQIEARVPLDPLPEYGPLARDMAAAEDPLAAAIFRGREILALLHPEARLDVGQAAYETLPCHGRGRADRALALERERFLPGLLAVSDATLAAFGIEGRVPLLDPVVSRIASGIPIGVKSPPDAPRRLFRSALGAILPRAAARRRDKMGFPMPLDAWLASSPWREFALDRINARSLGRFGFDGRRVRAAFESDGLSARTRWFLLALDVFDELLAKRSPTA